MIQFEIDTPTGTVRYKDTDGAFPAAINWNFDLGAVKAGEPIFLCKYDGNLNVSVSQKFKDGRFYNVDETEGIPGIPLCWAPITVIAPPEMPKELRQAMYRFDKEVSVHREDRQRREQPLYLLGNEPGNCRTNY